MEDNSKGDTAGIRSEEETKQGEKDSTYVQTENILKKGIWGLSGAKILKFRKTWKIWRIIYKAPKPDYKQAPEQYAKKIHRVYKQRTDSLNKEASRLSDELQNSQERISKLEKDVETQQNINEDYRTTLNEIYARIRKTSEKYKQ